MIKHNFTKQCLSIQVNKTDDGNVTLNISSDYSRTSRKSQLYVNEANVSDELERFWKSIKTKKLIMAFISFGHIDWYDDHTDIYEVPNFRIKRGLRKAKVSYYEHGSIPKDWSFDFKALFNPLKTVAPIMEVVKAALPERIFTAEHEKKFKKELLKILKQNRISYQIEEE